MKAHVLQDEFAMLHKFDPKSYWSNERFMAYLEWLEAQVMKLRTQSNGKRSVPKPKRLSRR